MDHIWSPWRYRYVTSGPAPAGCIFCEKAAAADDAANLVFFRGRHNYALLNLYPYTNGHLMIAPYVHVASLAEAPEEAAAELISLTRRAESALRSLYHPPGINLGMNLGECAGAGVAGHIHMHVLPRWPGDANFMSVIGETRVHIEDLSVTWAKLRDAFAGA
jgi:ATP adenylyltransferase